METILDRLGLGSTLASGVINRVWAEVVGEEVARRTQPDRLRNGRLYVTVSDAVWLQQLAMLKPQILARLRAYSETPVVREIFFTVGTSSLVHSHPQKDCQRRKTPLSPQMELRLLEVMGPVRDEECREVLARILRKAWETD